MAAKNKKIEVDIPFLTAVLDCATSCNIEDIDAAANEAFYFLKNNSINPYCKYETYDDFYNNEY